MTWSLIQSALGTYNWARQVDVQHFQWERKEGLLKQVEELKAQLQRKEEHRVSDE